MKKILITGGAGFIGAHLAKKLLSYDCQVDLIDNFSRGKNDRFLSCLAGDRRIRLIDRDLMNAGALNDIDHFYSHIYHLAAIIGVVNVLEKPFSVLKDNVAMTLNMLSLSKLQNRFERFIFSSTSEVYAGTLKNFTMKIPTPESTPIAMTDLAHPRTSYMLSKIYGEALCHQSGIPFTIIRPHNIYGPRMGMAHVIPELLKKASQARDNGCLEVFSVGQKRTFCYIDDAVEMLIRATKSSKCDGKTLNIGNQRPEIAIGDLAKLVMKVVGRDLKIKPLSDTPGSPTRRCPDMSNTIALTEYEATVGLELGIEKTYQWYRNNHLI